MKRSDELPRWWRQQALDSGFFKGRPPAPLPTTTAASESTPCRSTSCSACRTTPISVPPAFCSGRHRLHDQLQQGSNTAGDEVGSCVLVDETGLSNCSGVVRLTNRGTITFSFVNAPPPHKVLAITGGSGQFATVRGDGTLDENGDGTGTLALQLHP